RAPERRHSTVNRLANSLPGAKNLFKLLADLSRMPPLRGFGSRTPPTSRGQWRLKPERRALLWLVDHEDRGVGFGVLGFAGVGGHVIAGVTVEHETVVGMVAARPETDRLGEIPPVHDSASGSVRQENRQKIWVVGPVKATDLLPELVFG